MSQIRLPGLDEQCRCHPEPECSPQEGLGHGGWPVTYLTGSEPKKVLEGGRAESWTRRGKLFRGRWTQCLPTMV